MTYPFIVNVIGFLLLAVLAVVVLFRKRIKLCGRGWNYFRRYVSAILIGVSLLAFGHGFLMGPRPDLAMPRVVEGADSDSETWIAIAQHWFSGLELDKRVVNGIQYLRVDNSITGDNRPGALTGRWATFFFWLLIIVELHWRLLRDSTDAFVFALKTRSAGRHDVICGLGRVGRQIFNDSPKSQLICVIESDPAHPLLDEIRESGGYVLIGDATDDEILRKARVWNANEIFVTTGDDQRNTIVVEEIVKVVDEKLKSPDLARYANKRQIEAFAYVDNWEFLASLSKSGGNECGSHLRLHLFSESELVGENLICKQILQLEKMKQMAMAAISDCIDAEASGQTISCPDSGNLLPLHFFLFGFGEYGQSIARHIAHHAHFPNQKRSRLTVYFESPEQYRGFRQEFPAFSHFVRNTGRSLSFEPKHDIWSSLAPFPSTHGSSKSLDELADVPQKSNDPRACNYVCNAEFLRSPAYAGEHSIVERIARLIRVSDSIPVVVFAFDKPDQNLIWAINFQRAIHKFLVSDNGNEPVPVFWFKPVPSVLDQNYPEFSSTRLISFGSTNETVTRPNVEQGETQSLGRAIHEYYRRTASKETGTNTNYLDNLMAEMVDPGKLSPDYATLRKLQAEEAAAGTLPENMPWVLLEPVFRESNLHAAKHGAIKTWLLDLAQETIGSNESFDLNQHPSIIRLLAEMEHNRWMAERLMEGWRFAPEIDRHKQLRPTLCPISQFESVFTSLPKDFQDRYPGGAATWAKEQLDKDIESISIVWKYWQARKGSAAS